jgi:hypothetical protein
MNETLLRRFDLSLLAAGVGLRLQSGSNLRAAHSHPDEREKTCPPVSSTKKVSPVTE